MKGGAAEKIIVALDTPRWEIARTLIEKLSPHLQFVKVGSILFSLQGPAVLEKIALESSYLNTERKPFVVIKEVLGIGGIISAMMTTKCILKDARKEKSFQTDFLISVNQEFKNQNIQRTIH